MNLSVVGGEIVFRSLILGALLVVHSSAWAEGFFNDAKVDLTLKNFYQNRNFLGNNVAHAQPVGDWALGSNIGVFFGKEDGSARAGDLNNKTFTGLFSASYVVQSSTLKDLSVVWKNASARHSWRNSTTSDFDDNRLFVSYPVSLF